MLCILLLYSNSGYGFSFDVHGSCICCTSSCLVKFDVHALCAGWNYWINMWQHQLEGRVINCDHAWSYSNMVWHVHAILSGTSHRVRALLFLYLMLNMFWMLIHPSSGACDLCAELFHGLYWSGSMCVGGTLWYGCGGVVSVCRLKQVGVVLQPAYGYHTTTTIPQRNSNTSNQINTTHEITHHISRKLLRMDVLTSETCRALNKEIIKQVTSSWSLFTQLSRWCTVQ